MRVQGYRTRLGVLTCTLGLLAACASDARDPGGTPEGAGNGGVGGAGAPMAGGMMSPPPDTGGSSGTGGAGGSSIDAGHVGDAAASSGGMDGGAFDAGTAITPSSGGTITFQEIGATGWYPSRRDPASGDCDAIQTDTCCMTRHEITYDLLTPWSEELIMTLRGPMVVRQLAVYRPFWPSSGDWKRVAMFDASSGNAREGLSFDGDATPGAAFDGTVGNQCLIDVASDQPFACGPGSMPYCPASDEPKYYGWSESKLFVMLISMPHAGDGTIAAAQHCGNDAADNWYDAPWIGFSHGELVRSGKFGDCHCYAKNPAEWHLGDGCGQLNAFEVVNDNNAAMNLDVFSTSFFGYQGYIGEGPCGDQCDVGALVHEVDLIDKSTSQEAAAGAIATPSGGPGAEFMRPSREPRYFIVLFEEGSRSVQLAVISPARIPDAAAVVLPAIPERLTLADIRALLDMRLPR